MYFMYLKLALEIRKYKLIFSAFCMVFNICLSKIQSIPAFFMYST